MKRTVMLMVLGCKLELITLKALNAQRVQNDDHIVVIDNYPLATGPD